MGFTYLDGKDWIEVTREERLFCSYLYWDIKGKEHRFIEWLNINSELRLKSEDTWEVGYEVCFYRDLQKFKGKPLDLTRFSGKRTFDLCLFSESTIIIIEAKVQQMFKESDIQEFQKDRTNIPELTGKDLNIHIIALASSRYYENYSKYGKKNILSEPNFDTLISWKQMGELYRKNIYFEAEKKYRN